MVPPSAPLTHGRKQGARLVPTARYQTHRDPLANHAMCAHAARRVRRRPWRVSPAGCTTISPMRLARSPPRREVRSARSACPAATTTAMPMPQVENRDASRRRPHCRGAAASRKSRVASMHRASSRACRPAGSMRGTLSTSPPPVMCAMPLHRQLAQQRQQRLHVDARGREQRAAQVVAVVERMARRSRRRWSRRSCGSANSRWNAGRSMQGRSPRRPATIGVPSMIASLSTTPTAKPGEIVFARRGTCPASRRSRRRSARSPPARSPSAMPLITARGDVDVELAARVSSRGRTAARRPAPGCR